MADIQWVKPLTPDMIPDGCHPVWDANTQEWTFPTIQTPSVSPSEPVAPAPVTPEEKLNSIGLTVSDLKTLLGIA